MPLYFFDVDDGTRSFHDQFGLSLVRLEDVSNEAESLLRLLAYEHINNVKAITLKTLVRNADGRHVLQATIKAGQGRIIFKTVP